MPRLPPSELIDGSEFSSSSSDSDSLVNASQNFKMGAADHFSEIEELLTAIKSSLNSLFKTSMFIRSFAPKDKRTRASRTRPFPDSFDIMHIREKYPSIVTKAPELLHRLGESNARRRQYFKYWRDHNERQGMEEVEGEADVAKAAPKRKEDGATGIAFESGSVFTSQTKPSLLAETEATQMLLDATREEDITSFDALAVSVMSFATTFAENEEHLSFSPVPSDAREGNPFLCQYCFTYQTLRKERTERDWRKHVLQDLEPYICTFSTCSLDTFQSQHAWFDHEIVLHRCQWECQLCSEITFTSADALTNHLIRRYETRIAPNQVVAFVEQSKRPVHGILPEECPFCEDHWAETAENVADVHAVLVVTPDQFRSHLGHHLQQVALFALPRLHNEGDDEVGSNAVGGHPDRDDLSKGYSWGREDCGRGWSIISKSRCIIFTYAAFLGLYRQTRANRRVPELLPGSNRVFGTDLDTLFRRDGTAVPTIVLQCIQAVNLFGLDTEGIYRVSGSIKDIMELKDLFDSDSSQVDLRSPAAFGYDIANVTTLLKDFLRDLPDPVCTEAQYYAFIQAAEIDDDTVRRDTMHAIINNLPDPHYATLRVLMLHLERVAQHCDKNNMTSRILSICFGFTLMGVASQLGSLDISDTDRMEKAIETIILNASQIFDEDE